MAVHLIFRLAFILYYSDKKLKEKVFFFFFGVCIICLNNGWRQRWMGPAPNFWSQSGLIFFVLLINYSSFNLVGRYNFLFFYAKFSDRAHCLFNFLYCLARKQNGEFLFFFFLRNKMKRKGRKSLVLENKLCGSGTT